MSQENPNFYEVAQERRVLKREAKNLDKEGPAVQKRIKPKVVAQLAEIEKQAKEFKISDYSGLRGAIDKLKTSRRETGKVNLTGLGSSYQEIGEESRELFELKSYSFRRRRELVNLEKTATEKDRAELRSKKSLLDSTVEDVRKLKNGLDDLRREAPLEARAYDLVSYAEGLREAGHIAHTSSVDRYIEEIGERLVAGKPMFLHGPTGTGKTSLARFAAKLFTGQEAEEISCNPQTSEANIYGRTGIRPAGENQSSLETYFDWGPLAKAMREGRVVILDEFTALPKEQMSMLKGVMSKKVGDPYPIPRNGEVVIAPGFQMIFTANLKSEKNPERQDIPPEMANEFDQNNLKINYTPPAEAYDIMLSRLLNPDNSLDFSWYDLNTTLPKFCEALAEIQSAYADKLPEDTAKLVGAVSAGSKRPGLKKLVLNQRTVEAVLEAWRLTRLNHSNESFFSFLDQRLAKSLTFEEYPAGDRLLATQILASKGFLTTLTPEDLSLPSDVFDPTAIKKIRNDRATINKLLDESGAIRHLTLKEVAELDPFGLRARELAGVASEFLDEELNFDPKPFVKGKKRIMPGDIVKGKDGKELVYKGISKKDGLPVLLPLESKTGPSESDLAHQQSFLKDTFADNWSVSADRMKAFAPRADMVDPFTQDWEGLKGDVKTESDPFGEYTLNPEMQNLDFETAKPVVVSPDKITGNNMLEVAKNLKNVIDQLKTETGKDYYLPGLEYYEWLIENPSKTPAIFKDNNYYFFFGSVLRDSNGHWNVPYAIWDGSKWNRHARWLDGSWLSDCRVVLLER